MLITQRDAFIFHQYAIDRTGLAGIFFSLVFFLRSSSRFRTRCWNCFPLAERMTSSWHSPTQ
jgi:hypothetical protein